MGLEIYFHMGPGSSPGARADSREITRKEVENNLGHLNTICNSMAL